MCLDWGKLKRGKYQGSKLELYWCHNQGGNQVKFWFEVVSLSCPFVKRLGFHLPIMKLLRNAV